MTAIIKNKWYRINATLVVEEGRGFMYPSTYSDGSFQTFPIANKFIGTPFYVTDVDLEIDDIPRGSGRRSHPYIAGIVQGHEGIVYISSFNYWMFDSFD